MLTDRSITRGSGYHLTGRSTAGCSTLQPPSAAATQETIAQFRLPKLPAEPPATKLTRRQATKSGAETSGVYTRYGFVADSQVQPESSWNKRAAINPGPTFNEAVVAPVWSPLMTRLQADQEADQTRTSLFTDRPAVSCEHRADTMTYSAFGRSLSRGVSNVGTGRGGPAEEQQAKRLRMENEKKTGVQWVMKPLRQFQVDRKGQQRNQGPFSREFVVHARAPHSWMRLKWGPHY
ncbi:hypothetical protein BOX15_Mlig008960g2 [Macrostomum lignano]|uniref:Uncharacterized protein n=1 Tax=Macrostomum lignano TaxID=282301 RepID=A0A267FLD5_9PLAT|nr:hypothetical protein BOX15_Mlig008960g2 [Macrostomum lignano]